MAFGVDFFIKVILLLYYLVLKILDDNVTTIWFAALWIFPKIIAL